MAAPDGPIAGRVRATAIAWAHALTYAAAVTLVSVLGALVVGIATGGGFVRAKTLLFLLGLALMTYATARLWPSAPGDEEDDAVTSIDGAVPEAHDRTRFQRAVLALPPARWLPTPPPNRRFSPPGKLFLGSVLVLLTSYLMEARFGVV